MRISFLELNKLGIEIVSESQLVGYPTQFPSVSMVNWETGKPNARFRVLELLKNNFGPGDTLVATSDASADVAAQAFHTSSGRKLLLINKGSASVDVTLPQDAVGGQAAIVDSTSGENPARQAAVSEIRFNLTTFAVAVISEPVR